ncbi:hypothetical protein [Corynebacterium aquilae]|uniref:hypothetical protein n=1 Tax=Corynebacterium aquilae TaxID=203263 RepID=UPI0009518089|nr:hypothetical protein [Corynebacterium aquilae]
MSTPVTADFSALYPDIDPATPIPARLPERAGMAAGAAVCAGGIAMSNLLVAGVGALLCVIAALAAAQSPLRRVRAEAKARFPQAGWAENSRIKPTFVLALVCIWVIVAIVPAFSFLAVDATDATWWAVASALIAAIGVWFLPGLHPVWTRSRNTQRDVDSAAAH